MTINIALTSNPRIITNCIKVIGSVLGNSVKPDRVYLTLSHKDFPKYEQDLPQDLYKFIMTSNKVILNWIETTCDISGAIKSILSYLEPNDIIIPIDGVVNSNYVQQCVNQYMKTQSSILKVNGNKDDLKDYIVVKIGCNSSISKQQEVVKQQPKSQKPAPKQIKPSPKQSKKYHIANMFNHRFH